MKQKLATIKSLLQQKDKNLAKKFQRNNSFEHYLRIVLYFHILGKQHKAIPPKKIIRTRSKVMARGNDSCPAIIPYMATIPLLSHFRE